MQHAAPKVEELFYAALELGGSEVRSAFLDRACGDAELRRRVEELLDADPGLNDFLAAPASMPTVTAAHESRSVVEEPGTVIGPYKLLEAIGEGGMGTVYMAEQAEPVRRRVALKVIKPGMETKQVVARFEAERQALALMDHPNIAKVLDAGMAPSGRPYFVMELVQGLPITEYCDQHQLSIAKRLELFVLVCRAVQHAHQKGVIHRDLKPSNVLVTVIDGVGVPKVIDFGVAKATGQALTERTLFTGFHQFIGTPLYVSPEQAELSGVDVDTRSDIYSLGVLLYELLTGTTPFDTETLKRATFDEMRRIIREEEPPKPSTRLSSLGETLSTVSARRKADPRRLGASMKGELDWVVMKALEKDRRRRYETANDFAADVMNYLTDRPVEAFPPSNWYQFSKFAHRNRVALTTAGLLTALTVAGIALGTALVWREKEQTRRALLQSQAHARTAEERLGLARKAVDEMYTEVAEKWLAQEGKLSPLQRQFLEKALAFYEGFAAEKGGDPEARLEAAKAADRVGEIRHNLGLYDESLKAHRQALATYERLVADHPGRREYRRALAKSHHMVSGQLEMLGRLREAEEAIKKAIKLREALLAEVPDASEDRTGLADSLDLLGGRILRSSGRWEEAEQAARRAISLYEKLAADFPVNPLHRSDLSRAVMNLGATLENRTTIGPGSSYAEAEKLYRRALELRERLVAEVPDDIGHRWELALVHYNLGGNLRAAGRPGDAVEELRKAGDVLAKLIVEHPNRPVYRELSAQSLSLLAEALAESGHDRQAEQVARQALAEAEKLVAASPDLPDNRELIAQATSNLGFRLAKGGQTREARELLEKAYQQRTQLLDDHPTMAASKHNLAVLCLHMVRFYVACPSPEHRDPARALELAKKGLEVEPEMGGWWKLMGMAHWAARDWDAAIEAVQKEIARRNGGSYAFDWVILAAAHARKGDMMKAREWFAKLPPDFKPGDGPGDVPQPLYEEAVNLLGKDGQPLDPKGNCSVDVDQSK